MAGSFKLTASGETRALKIKQVQNPEDAVVSFMYENTTGEHTTVEFEEILDETQMDDEAARKVMDRLARRGFVAEV